jgi:hypothetical protein
MDKKNKGLVDDHNGDIILNESGTSVSFGWDTGESEENDTTASQPEENEDDKPKPSGDTDSRGRS